MERRGEERRKDFGMMDGHVKENSNLHSSFRRRVSFVFRFSNGKTGEREREKRETLKWRSE